ncbi:MAG: hypothetical protein NT088_01945 [Candidatus Omnitrophica bacterium]|nr:hypothetical protein [Candidatus Omnitrophota bacterium]
MKKIIFINIALFLVLTLAGCSYYNKMVSVFKPAPGKNLRARLTVADFEARAAKADNKIASELRQLLVNNLSSSKRIIVLERNDATADLIITAEVLEFEPQASGGRSGIGGGGGTESSAFGGLLGASSAKAHITLNIRIADIHSSQVLAAARIRGQVTDITGKNKTQANGSGLKGDLAVFANTPMERAISECISESARYVNSSIPERYFKY